MEEIKNKLYHLLKAELADLNIGHSFNEERLRYMKELCRLIIYASYVEFDPDLIKILSFYD